MPGCRHVKDSMPCHECTLPWTVVDLKEEDTYGVFDSWFLGSRGAIGYSPKPVEDPLGWTRFRKVDAQRIVEAVNSFQSMKDEIAKLKLKCDRAFEEGARAQRDADIRTITRDWYRDETGEKAADVLREEPLVSP